MSPWKSSIEITRQMRRLKIYMRDDLGRVDLLAGEVCSILPSMCKRTQESPRETNIPAEPEPDVD